MRGDYRRLKHLLGAVLIALCIVGILPANMRTAEAAAARQSSAKAVAGTKSGVKKKPKFMNKWVKKSDYTYYYGANGKKAKGLKKIGKKYYLFDSHGRQKIGWQKVKNDYYCFRIASGKGGYMMQGCTVNGIPLKKNGKSTVRSGNRLYCLMTASRIVESAARPNWSKGSKLRNAWNYFQSSYGYYGDPSFSLSGDWGVRYAANCFMAGHASCEGLGFAWAFVANACGASDCYAVCSGGHGWAEVEGCVYDPSWDRVDRRYSYFAMSKSMSGYDRIPNYAAYGCYRSKV